MASEKNAGEGKREKFARIHRRDCLAQTDIEAGYCATCAAIERGEHTAQGCHGRCVYCGWPVVMGKSEMPHCLNVGCTGGQP